MKAIFVFLLFIIINTSRSEEDCNGYFESVSAQEPSKENSGRFKIEVSGNPENYTPGEQYTIFLRGDAGEQAKFLEFLILARPDSPENSPGTLQLYGDSLTKFSEKCQDAIEHTDLTPKSEIQVLWSAPTTAGNCVTFKATVVESSELWYKHDGPLTKTLCRDNQDSEDVQPQILKRCCACDEAKYEVTFEGLWSRNTHPKDFPSNG